MQENSAHIFQKRFSGRLFCHPFFDEQSSVVENDYIESGMKEPCQGDMDFKVLYNA